MTRRTGDSSRRSRDGGFSSVITIQCQPCRLEPDGACSATSRHSRMRSSGTERVRSRRLRTVRVVVSNSSGDSGNVGMKLMIAARLRGVSSLVGAVPRRHLTTLRREDHVRLARRVRPPVPMMPLALACADAGHEAVIASGRPVSWAVAAADCSRVSAQPRVGLGDSGGQKAASRSARSGLQHGYVRRRNRRVRCPNDDRTM